jgi:hypothetical protein
VDQDYEARATVLLADPTAARNPRGNPYLEMSNSLATTARITASRLNDRGIRQDLVEQGLEGEPEVVWESEPQAPIIRLLVTGSDPEQANEGVSLIIDDMQEWLAASQTADGLPADTAVVAKVIQRADAPVGSGKGQKRAFLAIMAVGTGIGLWLCLLLEARARRRRARGAATDRPAADGALTGASA